MRPAWQDERDRAFGGTFLSLVALYLFLAWRTTPAALPVEAPPTVFSAGRAQAVLRNILGSEAPHPLGSREASVVRSRILAELEQLHIPASVHDGYACGKWARACGPVHNIVAKLPGRESGKAVLLSVHADSVAAGPGAADDGSGVASLLEIARILSMSPPLRHPVILLIDDGEEEGLLGAQAFADSDPWMNEVGAVVNLEARGTSGASRLFETSGPNGWLVQHVAKVLPHPATSSLDTTVYERLPNDTDLSVFKRSQLPGVNFAFIGDASRYHTPRDDVAHLNLASLQHQGDNGLAAVRALGNADFDQTPPGRAVFFDVLGFFIVSWPEPWSWGFARLTILLMLLTLWRVRPRPAPFIVFVRATLILGTVLLSFGIIYLLTKLGIWAGALPSPWVAWPAPTLLLTWCVPVTVYLALLWGMNLFVDDATDWLTTWGIWTIIGTALAATLPGLSYLFLLPALIAGLVGVITIPMKRPLTASIVPLLVAAVLWFPLLQVWYDAMGTRALPILAVLVALFGSALLPLLAMFERPRLGSAIGAFLPGMVVLLLVSASVPPHSEELPGPMNLQYRVDVDSHRATWHVLTFEPELPEAMTKITKFTHTPATPAVPIPTFVGDAGSSDLPGPEVTILERTELGALQKIKLHLKSARQASTLQVSHESGEGDVLSVNGVTARPKAGLSSYSFWDVPPEGIDIELTLNASEKQLTVSDVTPGLPPEAAAVLAARPKDLVPIQWGDSVTVSRVVTF